MFLHPRRKPVVAPQERLFSWQEQIISDHAVDSARYSLPRGYRRSPALQNLINETSLDSAMRSSLQQQALYGRSVTRVIYDEAISMEPVFSMEPGAINYTTTEHMSNPVLTIEILQEAYNTLRRNHESNN